MWEDDEWVPLTRKSLRRVGVPNSDPLGEVLEKLQKAGQDELVKIARREINKEDPIKDR